MENDSEKKIEETEPLRRSPNDRIRRCGSKYGQSVMSCRLAYVAKIRHRAPQEFQLLG